MKVIIKYKGSDLVIQGDIREASSITCYRESFDIEEMKCEDVHVHEDYDPDDYYEIIKLCIKEVKKSDHIQ